MSTPRPMSTPTGTCPAAALVTVLVLLALFAGGIRAEMMVGGFGPDPATGHPLRVFAPDAQGAAPALREIAGPATLLYEPMSGSYEPLEQVVYVSDFRGQAVRVYRAFDSGNAAPLRVLNPPQIGQTRANAPVPEHDELAVIVSNCCISTWPLTAEGNMPRLRALSWGGLPGGLTQLNNPAALAYLPDTDEYMVLDSEFGSWQPKIIFHARSASGNAAPTRTITGAAIAGARGLAYDRLSRRLFVLISATPVNGIAAGRIAVFADDASGDAVPLHTIEGSQTGLDLASGEQFYGIGHDPYRGRLMVSSAGGAPANNRIITFDDNASGNIAPIQLLQGTSVSPATIGIPFGIPAAAPDRLFAHGFESD